MKLPHWLQLGLGLLVIVITWIVQQNAAGNLMLPAVAITVLTAIKTLVGLFTDSVQDSLAAKRAAAAARSAVAVLVVFGLCAATQAGCSSALWQNLVTTIEKDLENGTALSALEAVVAQFFPQFAGDAAVLDSILQEVVSLLQASGVLPPAAQANAKAIQDQITAKLGAKKASDLPSDAQSVIAELERARDAGVQTERTRILVEAIRAQVAR